MAFAARWPRSCAALIAILWLGNTWGSARPPALTTLSDAADVMYRPGADLVIESATIELADACRPSEPLLYVSATIRNRGAAPTRLGQWQIIIYARDTYTRGWGNGLRMPGIGEGEHQSVTFPIYFLSSAPQSMSGTHNFIIDVMAGKNVEESDYANNRFGPVAVTVPRAHCLRDHPEQSNAGSGG